MKLNPYPKYKDSGIQWIGEIPEGWEVRKISSFGFFSSSGIDKKTEPDESLVKMVNYTDIYGNDSLVIDSKRELMTVSCPMEKIISCNLKRGDIVFTPSSETEEDIGLSAVILENLKNTVFSYHVIRFRPIIEIKLLYKKYIGNNHFVLSQFSRMCKGTTRQILTHNDFKGILTILPPIEDQTAIANFLDKKTAKMDKLIEKDKKLIALLKEKRTALINHAVTKGLDPNVKLKDSGIEWIGKIPEGWEVHRLKFKETVIMGQSPDSESYNYEYKGYPFLQGNAEFSDVHPNPSIWCDVANKYALRNDVLLSVRAPVGAINIADQKYGIGRGLCAIRVKINNLKYIFYQLLTCVDYLNSIGTGSTYTAISTEDIMNLPMRYPPLPDQTAIANYLDKATSKIDKTIKLIEKKIALLEEYKKSLIHHVVTGKVDVRGVEA